MNLTPGTCFRESRSSFVLNRTTPGDDGGGELDRVGRLDGAIGAKGGVVGGALSVEWHHHRDAPKD